MKKTYQIAGFTFRIETPFSFVEEERYQMFAADSDHDKSPDFVITFQATGKPMDYGEAFFQVSEINYYKTEQKMIEEHCDVMSKRPFRWLEIPYGDSYWKCWYLQEKESLFQYISQIFRHIGLNIMLNYKKALIFHCAFVKIKEIGILFSGPSGIGKSTQADLWKKWKRADIVNGDRAVLRENENHFEAWGLPYAGSSNICKNESAKIGAIVVLKQGPVNRVKKIESMDAYRAIVSQVFQNRWDTQLLTNVLDEAEKLINKVPIFQLTCTPDKEAVDCLCERLQEEKIIE